MQIITKTDMSQIYYPVGKIRILRNMRLETNLMIIYLQNLVANYIVRLNTM
jgi:hypothetical protein